MYIFCNKPSVYVGDQNAACHTSPVNRASVRKCNVNHEITATLSCIYIWQATIGVLTIVFDQWHLGVLEGVKWELAFASFFALGNGIRSTELDWDFATVNGILTK